MKLEKLIPKIPGIPNLHILTRPDYLPENVRLAFEKTYAPQGKQYESWVNPKITRKKVLKKVKLGDAVDFRLVPWETGHMLLCIHRDTGLDFGVLVSQIAYPLRHDYYGCILEGVVNGVDPITIHLKAWQPPEYMD